MVSVNAGPASLAEHQRRRFIHVPKRTWRSREETAADKLEGEEERRLQDAATGN